MGYRSRVLASFGLILTGLSGTVLTTTSAAGAAPVKVVTCAGKAVYKPTTYVLACGDGGAWLSAIHWTAWGAKSAVGTTTFEQNICTPNCAAGNIATYRHSIVHLSAPQSSKLGMVFTKPVVNYTRH